MSQVMSNQIQVSVEITSSLGRRLTVSVPTERVEQAVKERIQRISKTAKVAGFRPGKMPEKAAEKMFGGAARAEVADHLLQSSLQEAVVQEKLQPAGYPVIESFKADPGAPLQYTATFEVFPDVHLKSLSDVTLEKLVVNLADADVERVLEQMRKQHAEWKEVQQAAATGDRVTFDMIAGTGQKEQKGLQLILEEGAMPPEFAVLKGTKAGDDVKVQWQGADANLKIQKVESPLLPEINDEFAKRLGVSDGTIDGLKTEVRKHVQDELDKALHNKLKVQLIDKLLETHPLELPKSAIDAEYEHLAQEFRNRVKQQIGQEIKELPESVQQDTQVVARRRVALSLLFPAAIRQYDIKLDDSRLRAHIERAVASFENASAMIDMVYKDKKIMAGIRSQVLEEQVVEKLLEQVQYKEKNADYAEVMKFANEQQDMHGHHHEHEHVHDENCQHDH